MNPRRPVRVCATLLSVALLGVPLRPETVKLSRDVLLDKIQGGWAGQVIGCTFGGPTEFRFRSTFIPDYQPLTWTDDAPRWWYENAPGLYDDVYMDLTFVDILEREGLDAPAASFASSFANAPYPLWHANQAARYNILHGIPPPASGHWLNNPHADDIDFQIEADFAGLMAPGLPAAAAAYCDRIGHIMNSGDGWYGGVYVATMYSLAFVRDDVHRIVAEALAAIPPQSDFAKTIGDAIRRHDENPSDWKETWFKVQNKWGEDVGCPDGVFTPFNIDAKINAAWVVVGLLFGDGDFGRTLEISARCGDDSDCNPASAGGVLGTMLGFGRIPDEWKRGLAAVEDRAFAFSSLSLRDAAGLSFKHALEVVRRNGGEADGAEVAIPVRPIAPVALERNFEGLVPVERRRLQTALEKDFVFDFEGVGFALTGSATDKANPKGVVSVEMEIDGRSAEAIELPVEDRLRRETPFWKCDLEPGRHRVRLMIRYPRPGISVSLGDLVVYRIRSGTPAGGS
jgi:hypothetical protein